MAKSNTVKIERDIQSHDIKSDALRSDRQIASLKRELHETQLKYRTALAEIDRLGNRLEHHGELIKLRPRKLRAKKAKKDAPATAILVLSDWHIEETVLRETVAGLNEYSLPIARQRVENVWARAEMLLSHERGLVDIDHLVIACLGDFISGHIHDELMETCSLSPMAATREVGELLLGGIERMRSAFRRITVITAHGNHGRSTHKIRVATGADHSFEHNLYKWLEKATRGTKGLEWQIGEGYLNYMDVQGYTIRFHHGDAIRGGAGIGGLAMPLNRAKAKWDLSRPSDLDVCGHFHTSFYLPYKFLVNGCVIGMSPFGIRIGAEYQPPSQSLLVVDSRHGVTKALQVFADRDMRRAFVA